MKTLHLDACTVHVEQHLVCTVLPDGSTVHGEPHETEHYRATAREHGYGEDVARLNRCHELTHSLLAYWFGLPCSPVFQRVADELLAETDLTRLEETAVLGLERFANALGVDLERVAKRWGS